MTVSSQGHQGKNRKKGGKIKWKLFEVNTSAVSGGQNELSVELKKAAGDVIGIGG